MENKNQVQVVTSKTPLSTRFKQAGIVAATVAASNYALAEGSSIDTSGLTGELTGAKTVVLSLFALGMVLLGIYAGYRYLKRGANSA